MVAFAELGMEAIYEFDVKDMPVTVAVDSNGESVHESRPAGMEGADRRHPGGGRIVGRNSPRIASAPKPDTAMLTLYYSPGAASLVVHWLLIELDVQHELKLLDTDKREHKSAEYLKLNPNGVIPTLLVDGQPVYESAALVLFLADAYPMAGLAPPIDSLQRARYYQWLMHLANTVQPAFRNWFYPGEAAGEANAEATKEQAAAHRIELGSHRRAPGGERTLAARRQAFGRGLPPDHADALVAQHAEAGDGVAATGAGGERMKARPSFKKLYEIEQFTEWA